jgi:hypothetical protein
MEASKRHRRHALGAESGVRGQAIFFKPIRLFLPVQSFLKKYFAFAVGQIISTSSRRPASI